MEGQNILLLVWSSYSAPTLHLIIMIFFCREHSCSLSSVQVEGNRKAFNTNSHLKQQQSSMSITYYFNTFKKRLADALFTLT